jgi:hypothetical protein
MCNQTEYLVGGWNLMTREMDTKDVVVFTRDDPYKILKDYWHLEAWRMILREEIK